ncbi:hypothetical protein AQ490_22975 [Wenjunlia vitaminophila]|uniref:Uncharacterized protein n=1 Tax=Wenjunlia vitaminophila TaxID=76728 RepID=A0A0T6LRY4_WENVI|nr:hypothetical protein AQ490_22975 [Wenjunlia vitaminophila]
MKQTPLPWTPPFGLGIHLQPAGEWWDAVKVPAGTARDVLDWLGARSGAVIDDDRQRAWYWLVPLGTAAQWLVPGTRPCGPGTFVGVPGTLQTLGPGPHWRVTMAPDRFLTDPDALRAALATARLRTPS